MLQRLFHYFLLVIFRTPNPWKGTSTPPPNQVKTQIMPSSRAALQGNRGISIFTVPRLKSQQEPQQCPHIRISQVAFKPQGPGCTLHTRYQQVFRALQKILINEYVLERVSLTWSCIKFTPVSFT